MTNPACLEPGFRCHPLFVERPMEGVDKSWVSHVSRMIVSASDGHISLSWHEPHSEGDLLMLLNGVRDYWGGEQAAAWRWTRGNKTPTGADVWHLTDGPAISKADMN